MNNAHNFHIPVMGLGFTIDSPIKIAHYGISSVISLVDDTILEVMREHHSKKLNLSFRAISNKVEDFRAKRITEYLNFIDKVVQRNVESLIGSASGKSDEIKKYFELLPDTSRLKQNYQLFIKENPTVNKFKEWLRRNLHIGSIDVNIMTKLDKTNYGKNKKPLPLEFNDGHAAIRGFAKSSVKSSLVLSAGMNPKLYGSMEQFDEFYPTKDGEINKKIIIKVSDFRSAFIQAKFLAKKGLWISEYRVESGLNCGGHAFATQGQLMGPILDEFRLNRNKLISLYFELLIPALTKKKKEIPLVPPDVKITAQGGVGTSEEHDFLMNEYQLDGVGWGSPFLLVDEVSTIDKETQSLIEDATEDDLYLSDISPLGVKFNSLHGNSMDKAKIDKIEKDKPGSACPLKYCEINTEVSAKPICTASRLYQHLKMKNLESSNVEKADKISEMSNVTDKCCLCIGLTSSVFKANNIITKNYRLEGVSVCPGPNVAYFNKKMTLKEMVDHIYGKHNVIDRSDRPHMFIKELILYIDYLKEKIKEDGNNSYIDKFKLNLQNGIDYYKKLFSNKTNELNALSLIESKLISSR